MKRQFVIEIAAAIKKPALCLLAVSLLAACAGNTSQRAADSADEAAEVAVVVPVQLPVESPAVDVPAAAIALENVFYFAYDQALLSDEVRAALDAQAAARRGGSDRLRIEGHTDERGSREYNLALGERRARAVADYLAIQGIARVRMELVSYGEERPVSLRSDEAAHRLNRRVELK